MATKTDFTPDEWTQLVKAPGWASLVVVAASPSGPLGVIKEMFAAGKVLAEATIKGDQGSLVTAVVSDLTTSEGRKQAQPSEASGKTPEELRQRALDALKQVAALLDRKAGADATDYKRWLASLAERVAQASKEGGFLGIGGTRVSEQEAAALRDISTTLGISA